MKDEALKLALEVMHDQGDVGVDEWIAAEAAIKQALAAPVQEPVACVQDLDEVKRKHLVYEKGMDWKDPLYTTPPAQRQWVGLTDEEIKNCIGGMFRSGDPWLSFARAVEAKLREKNQ